jgi:hypothetical protein
MCFLLCISFSAMAQLNTPRGSEMASVMQRVGTTDLTITYSRPSVKNREIWRELVPCGMNNLGFGTSKAAPWHAGANENTTITLTHTAKIEGKSIEAGTYGLHINVKDADNATIILSKDTDARGSYFYDPANDALRAAVKLKENKHTELLTYEFNDVDANSTTAELAWGKKAIPFKIEVDVTDIVLEDIRGQFKGYGEAMDEAVTIANATQINRMGYAMITAKDYDRAVKYVKSDPKSANWYDSLGEAYKAKGDKKNAVKHFKKSLGLNPVANIKVNSEKNLKEPKRTWSSIRISSIKHI